MGATFGAFTFNMVITDVTDGATGTFVGTSTGGSVFLDQSTIVIAWAPAQIGTGTNHASSGSFGSTFFTVDAVHHHCESHVRRADRQHYGAGSSGWSEWNPRAGHA